MGEEDQMVCGGEIWMNPMSKAPTHDALESLAHMRVAHLAR